MVERMLTLEIEKRLVMKMTNSSQLVPVAPYFCYYPLPCCYVPLSILQA